VPPRTIFIVRHGEKPDPPVPPAKTSSPPGLDVYGKPNDHSLVPRGWHRAAALATLFAPAQGPLRPGLLTPTELIAPDYGDDEKNLVHRTNQTILPLARLLSLHIEKAGGKEKGNPVSFQEGNEPAIGEVVANELAGVTLICWEHTAIYQIASNIPTVAGTRIPQHWPGKRFDVIYSFTRNSNSGPYTFTQILQELFADDGTTTIPP